MRAVSVGAAVVHCGRGLGAFGIRKNIVRNCGKDKQS